MAFSDLITTRHCCQYLSERANAYVILSWPEIQERKNVFGPELTLLQVAHHAE